MSGLDFALTVFACAAVRCCKQVAAFGALATTGAMLARTRLALSPPLPPRTIDEVNDAYFIVRDAAGYQRGLLAS